MTSPPRTRRAHVGGTGHLPRHLITGLAAQFLLGMAVNLLGLPSQAAGAARETSTVFLAVHALIALGLLIAAAVAIRTAKTNRDRQLAIWGAAAIAATTTAGILTVATKSNWWSYGMAVGFITSLLIYADLLRTSPEHQQSAPADNHYPGLPR